MRKCLIWDQVIKQWLLAQVLCLSWSCLCLVFFLICFCGKERYNILSCSTEQALCSQGASRGLFASTQWQFQAKNSSRVGGTTWVPNACAGFRSRDSQALWLQALSSIGSSLTLHCCELLSTKVVGSSHGQLMLSFLSHERQGPQASWLSSYCELSQSLEVARICSPTGLYSLCFLPLLSP